MSANEEVSDAPSVITQSSDLRTSEPVRVPQYRRDVFPTNVVLSADDLREFCELIAESNQRAKAIEYNKLDLTRFESPEQARDRVNEFMPIEYNFTETNGDSVQGLGIPRTDEYTFPDDLRSFFVSNASYAKRAIDVRPLNTIEAFLGFEKPSLKIDLQTLPSNPTENRSVINVTGRDEDWVISTSNRIHSFFQKRKTFRPIIHGSGTYDYFIYLAFLPALLWFFYENGVSASAWLNNQSVFLNVILGIYVILLSLLVGRFVFQYFRWLFPPMEYYKRSRWSSYIHRSIAGAVGSALLLSAGYDLVKAVVIAILG